MKALLLNFLKRNSQTEYKKVDFISAIIFFFLEKKITESHSFTYGENFPSTNLESPVSYTRTGVPSHIWR